MTEDLAGKFVVITGLSRGIGASLARAFHEQSAKLHLIALDEGIYGVAEELGATSSKADIAIESDVVMALAPLQRIDVLINNAGILEEREIADITANHIERMFAINVHGAILLTRAVLPHLSDGARIINIASELAYLGRAGASVYCATKAAMLGLTRSWARELAPRIHVNAFALGPTDTPLLAFESLTPQQKAQETILPLARIGKPEEIAQSVLFLAGPGATLFVGQCLGANGGAAMM